MQLLGYVDFYVGDLIKVWDTQCKKRFLKREKTEEDIKFINRCRKKDFYTEYMCRKYEKMELVTKEGIMRPRMLDYAAIIMKVEEELRPLTRMPSILNRNTTRNFVKKYCRTHKIPTSIVGEELMTQEVEGILSLWKSYWSVIKQQQGLDKQKTKLDIEEYNIRQRLMGETRDKIMETIQAQLDELQRYKEINDEYNEQKGGRTNKKNKKIAVTNKQS